ncbi:MAG: MOSC N-terminal beta barrel domain-containing protein [Betaproteobacteria bacterium]
MDATLTALSIYPVKSCRGIALDASRLTMRGLEHDREWMLVDLDGRFLTQRQLPRMAQIVPKLSISALQLSAPGMPAFSIPLESDAERMTVTVWRDILGALDQGDEAATKLSRWLGSDVRLVRFDPEERRYCNPQYAGNDGAHHAFADGYPVLVISVASLADLNGRLDDPLPMNRFRPNMVIDGVDAFDEDHFTEIGIGDITLRLVKPCVRCRITTTDQVTAEVGIEPLPTLASYRRDDALEGVTFGMNAIVAAGAGATLAVGDAVRANLDF